uniref:Uncharacterized protein n=1 Tax=Cucumis melo TaxID=3656 RepID=A0A9I9CGB0_CUCME
MEKLPTPYTYASALRDRVTIHYKKSRFSDVEKGVGRTNVEKYALSRATFHTSSK